MHETISNLGVTPLELTADLIFLWRNGQVFTISDGTQLDSNWIF